jgi:hypothetical protein
MEPIWPAAFTCSYLVIQPAVTPSEVKGDM